MQFMKIIGLPEDVRRQLDFWAREAIVAELEQHQKEKLLANLTRGDSMLSANAMGGTIASLGELAYENLMADSDNYAMSFEDRAKQLSGCIGHDAEYEFIDTVYGDAPVREFDSAELSEDHRDLSEEERWAWLNKVWEEEDEERENLRMQHTSELDPFHHRPQQDRFEHPEIVEAFDAQREPIGMCTCRQGYLITTLKAHLHASVKVIEEYVFNGEVINKGQTYEESVALETQRFHDRLNDKRAYRGRQFAKRKPGVQRIHGKRSEPLMTTGDGDLKLWIQTRLHEGLPLEPERVESLEMREFVNEQAANDFEDEQPLSEIIDEIMELLTELGKVLAESNRVTSRAA